MFRNLLLLLALFAATTAFSQPYIAWQKTYGGTADETMFSMKTTFDSGFIMAGSARSNNGDVTGYQLNGDLWIAKSTSTGALSWAKCYGGSYYDEADAVTQTTDGGYIVAGYTNSTDGDITSFFGDFDGWLLKLDDTGGIVWQHNYGGRGIDRLLNVIQTRDGGYLAVGGSSSRDSEVNNIHDTAFYDLWALRLNSVGDIIWSKTFGGNNNEEAWSVIEALDGGFILSGYTSSNDGDVTRFKGGPTDFWAIRLDDTGQLVWQKTFGGTGDEQSQSMITTTDGYYVMVGNTSSNDSDVTDNHGGYDMWAVKFDGAGNLMHEKCYGGSDDDDAQAVIQNPDGGFMLAGTSFSADGDLRINYGSGDYWVIKTDALWEKIWQKNFGGDSTEIAFSLCNTPDGLFALGGFTMSNNGDVSFNHGTAGTNDFWLVKFGVTPFDQVKSVTDGENTSIYPIPDAGTIHVTLNTPLIENATITLIDGMGRVCKTINATTGDNIINYPEMPTGVYLLQINNGAKRQSFQLVHGGR